MHGRIPIFSTARCFKTLSKQIEIDRLFDQSKKCKKFKVSFPNLQPPSTLIPSSSSKLNFDCPRREEEKPKSLSRLRSAFTRRGEAGRGGEAERGGPRVHMRHTV